MEKFFEDQILYDFYGSLLTDHQRKIMNLYYEEDLGLSEISETLEVSRQAVYDIIHRSLKLLKNFESSLHLIEKEDKIKHLLKKVNKELTEIKSEVKNSFFEEKLDDCLSVIKEIQNEM